MWWRGGVAEGECPLTDFAADRRGQTLGDNRVGLRRREMAAQSLEIVNQIAGCDDHRLRGDRAAVGPDLNELAAGAHAPDGGFLMETRAACRRRDCQANTGSVRIERFAARPDSAVRRNGGFRAEGSRIQPGRLDAGFASDLMLTLKATRGVRAIAREHEEVLRNEIGANVQPAERGGEVQRRAPEPLPHVPGSAKPMLCGRFLKPGVEVLPQQPFARSGGRGADPIGFDEHDRNTGSRKRRSAGTAGQAATDDSHACPNIAAMSRIAGTAAPGERIEEVREGPHATWNSNLNRRAPVHAVCYEIPKLPVTSLRRTEMPSVCWLSRWRLDPMS